MNAPKSRSAFPLRGMDHPFPHDTLRNRRSIWSVFACLACVSTWGLTVPTVTFGQAGSYVISRGGPGTTKPATDHAARSLAAIDLAVMAAESGLIDVSLEAMRRAVAKGPPVSSTDLGGLLSSAPQSANVRSRGTQAGQEAATAQSRLANRLLRLHRVWQAREVDPQQAYAAWRELVLPTGRPNEAFAYSVSGPLQNSFSYSSVDFQIEPPEVADCGAAALVHWAAAADKLDELRQELANREPLPGAADVVLLTKVILARRESASPKEVTAVLEELSQRPKMLIQDPQAELFSGHAFQLLDQEHSQSAAGRDLVERVLAAIPTYENWPANRWMEYLVSRELRESVEAGDQERLDRAADIAATRYARLRANNQSYVASRIASMYGAAARRAFEAGHPELGVACLRRQNVEAMSGGSSNSQVGNMIDPSNPIAKALLTMDRAPRFALFQDMVWNMPALGLTRCARMNVLDDVPALFAGGAASGDHEPLPARQIASAQARSMSLLEWCMRDAIALGKEQEIEERIAELEARGSDDAPLARLVFGLARDEPLDLQLLMETNEEGNVKLRSVLGEDQEVAPLDIAIVGQALASPAFHTAGVELLEERFQTAVELHQDFAVTWLRKLKADEATAAGDPPVSHRALKHWIVSNDVSEGDTLSGKVPDTLWMQRGDGVWGHQYGTHVAYLLFRYPLQGDFTISFRAKDGTYQEGGATYGGLLIEFLRYLNRLRLWTVSRRGMADVETTAMKENEFNHYRLARAGDSLTVHVGDEFEQSLDLPGDAFPFFGLCSYNYRATAVDSLQIDGEVHIPREVALLSPTLAGWSTMFKGQRLPEANILPGRSPSTAPDGREPPDWQYIDGVLESVAAPSPKPGSKQETADQDPPRQESFIQYLRPLCDGEEIALEFFYEPGKFNLSPAIGRIAMLLDESEIGLRWITSDPKGIWVGPGAGNRVVDPAAESLAPVELNPGEWNELSLRLEGDTAILRLNGEDVYRRAWTEATDRKFGIFHNPAEYHVKVRHVRLTGDWPEQLPGKLFELVRQPVARRVAFSN